MAGRRINRFVDTAAPVEGASGGKELQALEKKYTLDQAVALFREERNTSVLLRMACIKAEELFNSGYVGKNLGNLSSLDYDSRVAIVAFTLEEPNDICREFNSQSRSLTPSTWNRFDFKGMWLLLNKAIQSHGNLSSSLTVYRGITALINASPNMDFCFRQVSSTSKDSKVAQEFANGQGTLFIIKSSRCLSIRALSEFPEEEEYILPAFDTFKVTKVENTGGCRKIYLEA